MKKKQQVSMPRTDKFFEYIVPRARKYGWLDEPDFEMLCITLNKDPPSRDAPQGEKEVSDEEIDDEEEMGNVNDEWVTIKNIYKNNNFLNILTH